MTIDVLISPRQGHADSGPSTLKRSASRHTQAAVTYDTWCDHAQRREWQMALLAYLRTRWRQAVPLWEVVNCVAAEAWPEDRAQSREFKRQILNELGRLTRCRKI